MTDRRSPLFVGRAALLAALTRQLDDVRTTGTGRIVAMRGRRQVGKSSAVERFVATQSVPYIYATGIFQAPLGKQLADATSAIRQSTRPVADAALLTQTPAPTWQEWFARIALAARSGPVVVILDEFPWLAAADPTLEGELQAQWDRVLSKVPVLLFLIGSDVAMMDSLATHGRPLFGRVTPIVVPPLNPAEIAAALPGRAAAEVFDAALVTGGYPRLVTDLARHRALTTVAYVRESLTDPYSPLITTARLSLDAEFAEPQAAYQVLSTIGSSETAHLGFTDVVDVIGDSSDRKRVETATTRALRLLTEIKGLVEREQPAWAPASSRLRRYRVTDPYLRFWFRYIEDRVDFIARGRADLAIDAFDRDWESWRGRSIEPLVRQSLLRLGASTPTLAGVEDVRPWWVRDNNTEVDVVATTREATALLGTVKWRRKGGPTQREVDSLRDLRARVPRSEHALIAAISPDGTAPANADVSFSAADLLDAWRA